MRAAVGRRHHRGMHSVSVDPLPGFPESHPSLAAFYAADRRRWPSRERDVGLHWRAGACTYRAAFVEATGELYVFEHRRADGGGGMVFVHRTAVDASRIDDAFEGWQDACGEEESFDWLLARVNRSPAGGGRT